jgi:hypothetical protein
VPITNRRRLRNTPAEDVTAYVHCFSAQGERLTQRGARGHWRGLGSETRTLAPGETLPLDSVAKRDRETSAYVYVDEGYGLGDFRIADPSAFLVTVEVRGSFKPIRRTFRVMTEGSDLRAEPLRR